MKTSDLIALEVQADAMLTKVHALLKPYLEGKDWVKRVRRDDKTPEGAYALERAWTQLGQAHGNIGKAIDAQAGDEARKKVPK